MIPRRINNYVFLNSTMYLHFNCWDYYASWQSLHLVIRILKIIKNSTFFPLPKKVFFIPLCAYESLSLSSIYQKLELPNQVNFLFSWVSPNYSQKGYSFIILTALIKSSLSLSFPAYNFIKFSDFIPYDSRKCFIILKIVFF